MLILAVPRPRLPPPERESLSAPEPLAKDWSRRPEGSDKSPVSGGAGRLGVDLYPLRTLRPVRKPPRVQKCPSWAALKNAQPGLGPRAASARPGALRWKRFCGSLATDRSQNVNRMEAKGWPFTFFAFGSVEGGRTS